MAQPLDSIHFSQLLIIAFLLLPLTSVLKLILMAKDFCRYGVEKLHKLFQHHQDYDEVNIDERPLPSWVQVPLMAHVVSNFIKTKLLAVEFSISKLGANIGEQSLSAECVICLEGVKGSEEIRELGNCSHLHHIGCIDGWVDQGHGTCPLCGRKLMPM
ncbi:hypothetical protein V6N11_037273 [Hibiscus sabdariffa]|uniref:RING-type domain-containing protein n=1 Tax=Hibiscus sabdariffa TaxID=183260 RepID=A0ABR2P1A1_9ROSI